MWIESNPNPCGRRVGDCVIRAVCFALNLDWETAFWIMCDSAFQLCDMPSSNSVLSTVLRKNGFYREAIPNSCPDCYTAANFCEGHPHGVYVLGFGSHVACVINGNIMDSWDSSNEIPQYYFYRKET